MALRGNSQEKLQERLRSQESQINRLNYQADGLRNRIQQVEESKQALTNNRQFRESQEKFEQQISNLESDKVSLMKRLNMVLSELEKATHEKSEINAKLLEQERMAEDLKRKLDEVTSLKNVVNRNLQEDLRYERELNEKLREELNKFEKEKDQLLGKLKEQEELSKEIGKETNALNQNLTRKTEDLRKLEREHENNLLRLRELNNQLDSVRQQEAHSKNEKRRMEDQLDDLTRERNELIRRMNDLSDKYEEYVTTMNRERIEIMKANKNHVKLLTAKLFFQILNEAILQRKKHGFQEIKQCAGQINNMERKLYKFSRVIGYYGLDRKRHYLRKWYRNAMNFIHENYKKINLIEFNVSKKRKIKYYYKWREAFLRRRRFFDSKIDAIKIINTMLGGKKDLSVRKYLCKWRDFVQLRACQQDFMTSVMSRKKNRILRVGFVRWLGFTKRTALEERYENMSELITNLWFKQRVFLALRQACLESQTENSVLKFKAWKSWCEKARKTKYFQRKKLLVERLTGTRDDRFLRKYFDAIRFHNINRKYEETKEQLDKEIPLRQELERKRDAMIKVNVSKDKYNLFRSLFIRIADVKYRALMVWKENIKFQSDVMKKIKLRVIEIHKKRCSKAFFKWKESIDKKHMVELVTFTEDLVNENQELKNTLSACQREKEKLMDCSGRQKGLKIERIRNMLNRNLLRKRFQQWVQNATLVVDLEDAIFKTSKTIKRRKLRNAFIKYRKQVQEVKRAEYIAQKVMWFDSVRERKLMDICYDAWKEFIKGYKQAKVFLNRSIKGVDKSIKNDAFELWKKMVFVKRKQVYVENIQELKRRQAEHDKQINDLNKQLQINEGKQKHLLSKMQQQSQKIMANFISRQVHCSQAKGFYTWLDALKEFKNRKRFMKTMMNYQFKKQEGKAFRTWAENTLKQKESEFAQNLLSKEQERKNLQRLKDEDEKKQNYEVENLNLELQEAIQTKEQLKRNYDKALQTHVNRLNNNTYIEKTRNIFCVWADYIKREKNAVNIIGAIARKNMRMEVFTRIRLVARENYLDDRAYRLLFKFCRLMKSRVLLNSFSKWRGINYKKMVQTMNQKSEELVNIQQMQQRELENMELQKQKKAEKILKQKRQREISMAWMQMAKVLRALKVKNELLKVNMKFMQQRWATRRWYQRTQKTLFLRRRNEKVIMEFQSKIAQQCLRAWRERTRIEKTLCQRIVKFVKRLSYLDIASSFYQINHYKKSFEARIKERKSQGQMTIQNTLQRLLRHKLADALLTLKNRAFKRDFKENFLKRVFQHSLTYRRRYYFQKWKINSEKQSLADYINTEGDVVLERNDMKRNVKCLKDFLTKQGYSPEEIEDYLQKRGEDQRGQMQKAVFGFFFKNSDFQIIPKAFNQWKRWIFVRRLCKRYSQFVVQSLNHPLHWAFRRWRYGEQIGKERLKGLTKSDLIEKIIGDELAIGSAKSRIGRMNEAIEHLNIQRDSLLQHFISGQKLALALGKNNYLKTMFRSFIKWKRYTKAYEQDRLNEQLDRTDQMIRDLMKHIQKLEKMNKGLVVENEELRQAALDGIEIAKAVQELTREREQLSVDLQDRASTIKKLIEDNNNLSLRLSIAQKEAEQLEQLNQQSYMVPPERDKYY